VPAKKSRKTKMVNASPTKGFFVEMLTRDIELEDAILDLLDNCVDGIQRSLEGHSPSDKPYKNFWAKISFSSQQFKIEDNCGGIPTQIAEQYAFRMGRPEEIVYKDYAIGTYGIGMKRAIFKIGQQSQIISQTQADAFRVEIAPQWLTSDDDWELPFKEESQQRSIENGTTIEITNLRSGIAKVFELSEHSALHNSLFGKISHHYSYIINKGFTIWVNSIKVLPMPLNLLWEGGKAIEEKGKVLAPYLYKGRRDEVEIDLAVGFSGPTASETEIDQDKQGIRKRSSDTAGWTIICNDRVILYGDKSRLTGWGEAKVPSFHPQFIGISGIVHFRSTNARNLPITTTKRGIDSSSDLYLYVKDFMREGVMHFTSYTNKWKKNIYAEREISSKAISATLSKIFDELPSNAWTDVRKKSGDQASQTEGKKYVPNLPTPKDSQKGPKMAKIIFSKPVDEIQTVSEYIFDSSDREPPEVGEACFDRVLREAGQ
jgi:Histidine kinase-, DNA gyrase B-, and HSP90-like ATPase